MARYIDADRFDIITSQRHSEDFIDGMDYILDKIDNAPTEDVVPRSEVEKIFEDIENFAKEDIRQRQKYLDKFYGKNSKFNDTRSNWLGGKIDGIEEFMKECIAELKKKYIGEEKWKKQI